VYVCNIFPTTLKLQPQFSRNPPSSFLPKHFRSCCFLVYSVKSIYVQASYSIIILHDYVNWKLKENHHIIWYLKSCGGGVNYYFLLVIHFGFHFSNLSPWKDEHGVWEEFIDFKDLFAYQIKWMVFILCFSLYDTSDFIEVCAKIEHK